jgi:hypothetical protein
MDDPTTIENNKNVGLQEPEYYIKVNEKQAADQGYTRGYEAGRKPTIPAEDVRSAVEEITGIPAVLSWFNQTNYELTKACAEGYRRGFDDGRKAQAS